MTENRVKPDDPFLLNYNPSDLRIASEFLTTWLPFLSRDLCPDCTRILSSRIRSLDLESEENGKELKESEKLSNNDGNLKEVVVGDEDHGDCDANSLGSWQDVAEGSMSSPRKSWADMVQEDDELGEGEEEEEEEEEDGEEEGRRLVSVDRSRGGLRISKVVEEKPNLSREQREYLRFMKVQRSKDFICLERVNGRIVNILDGLELHKLVFSAAEQRRIVDFVYNLQEMGSKGELKG